MSEGYQLLDSGAGRKLECVGAYVVDRPCAQAVWRPCLSAPEWDRADARFSRDGGSTWVFNGTVPAAWQVCLEGLEFEVGPTDFGHLGVFPEHALAWRLLGEHLRPGDEVLNLFAYSGAATLAAARAGARVCHVDASRKTVAQARRNAALNGLADAPIRWITDDVRKFLRRDVRRGQRYAGIVLDPPSFGRGRRQEVFKIEDHLVELLELCRAVLSAAPRFILLSCHTPGYTPLVLHHLVAQLMAESDGTVSAGEMVLVGGEGVFSVPSGAYACWCSSPSS